MKKGGQKIGHVIKKPSFTAGILVSEAGSEISDAISSSSNEADDEKSDKYYSANDDSDLTAMYSDYNQYDQYANDEFEFDNELHDKILRLRNDLRKLKGQFSSAGPSPVFKANVILVVLIMVINVIVLI